MIVKNPVKIRLPASSYYNMRLLHSIFAGLLCYIKNLLSFSLNQAILCETDLYYYHNPYNAVVGWHHLLPGILAEKYDLIEGGADKGKN
jgi:hypothetical protein